ncbi:MAG: serine/threonine protein kinase [Polyangiaceae bacterium]|nr:serine/threonine protein kinase [Polyangiaceae bacterium]
MRVGAKATTERLGTTIGGKWRLEHVIGVGASATVYAATGEVGERAAVKVLHEEVAKREDLRQRFVREAKLAARVDHPGIVRLLDENAQDPETAYIAMELLNGETLGARAQRLGNIPIADLLGIADQVLDVLAAAHAAGVVHRDLKPDNIFLTREGSVRLLDFGIARLVVPGQESGTRTGVTIGTAAYMSPEQAAGRTSEIDGRTDLFALGAILFRLVAGRRVHEADTDTALISAMATRPAPPFAKVCPTAPAGLAAVIDLAVGFDRNARYPDARTMQHDVGAVRAGQPPPHASSVVESAAQATLAPGFEPRRPGARASDAEPPSAVDRGAALDGEDGDNEAADELVGQIVAGRYRVHHLLGTGGMGAVYRAEHVHMRKTIALKVLHREMTSVPEVVARFEREAIAASRVEHPNVVAATDFGKLENGAYYLTLEYVEGRSLRDLLDAEGALAPDRAARIAAQVASALGEAHAQGIVHRDLKPDNVMLVERPDSPEHVKVLDFGIAKVAAGSLPGQPALTKFGSVFGTPEYMSPEQAMGVAVDHRADLYALGILLYEMLAGTTPFHSDEVIAILAQHMTARPPPLPPSVPRPLGTLVQQLLEKRPDDRPADARVVETTLRQLATTAEAAGAQPASRADDAMAFSPTILQLPNGGLPALLHRIRPALPRSLPELRAALTRELELGGQLVPVWALVVASAFLSLGGIFVTSALLSRSAASSTGHNERVAMASADTVDGEATPKMTLAEAASAAATRPEGERSAADWRAIALGHADDLASALHAARRAIAADPTLIGDPALGALVRRGADHSELGGVAVELAARMGGQGADILYDVWRAGQKVPERRATANLADERLRSEGLRPQLSLPLSIAIGLRPGKPCLEYKNLMEDAVAHADERSEPHLAKLTKVEYCRVGPFGLRQVDCWGCLRGDDRLPKALERARNTPGPRFGTDPVP